MSNRIQYENWIDEVTSKKLVITWRVLARNWLLVEINVKRVILVQRNFLVTYLASRSKCKKEISWSSTLFLLSVSSVPSSHHSLSFLVAVISTVHMAILSICTVHMAIPLYSPIKHFSFRSRITKTKYLFGIYLTTVKLNFQIKKFELQVTPPALTSS